ncbi:hypothetical protein H2200_006252 [Cladophialophora chaetospira]|uniref:Heterokaryon incompatibility domain-containing protein n=1 Tax=Cladophialophora chaetospira TaxID=386627 RepID=A0AA38XAP5_9EURO|nr:hypothetical protein H2200_006252 [Cladophialophora chaetospira]
MSDLPDYSYQTLLPHDDTRVIRLLPSQNAEDDVVLKIEHVGIGDEAHAPTIPYKALSYVCGDDDPPRFVQISNGTKLRVRPNLLDALRLLRSTTEESVFWVDQVSVHQQNLEERAIQVRNFGRIFGRAESVSVVLRESDPPFAMTAFSFIITLVENIGKSGLLDNMDQNAGRFLDVLLDLPLAGDPRWQAVISFLQNEWFFRAWTLQEVAVAKKATFMCGKHSLSLEAFMLVASMWTTFPESQHTKNYRLRDAALVFRRISYLRMVAYPSKGRTEIVPYAAEIGSLLNILRDLRSLRCRDPRDKIWSIVSIANDYDECALTVDYKSSWQSVYIKVCHWLRDRHQSLGFLQLVEIRARNMRGDIDQNRPVGLPSWVPAFHVEPQFLNMLYQPRVTVRPEGLKIYNASGSSRIGSQGQNASDPALRCEGLRIGVITVLSNPAGNLMNDNRGIGVRVLHGGEWHELARSVCGRGGIYYPTGESADVAYKRLRVNDVFPSFKRRSRTQLPVDLPEPADFAFVAVSPNSGDNYIDGDVNDIGRSILCATTRRRMFVTDTGYMGLTHRSNRIGDEIWVLMGADMPVTLHPVSLETGLQSATSSILTECRKFEFRGESYCHGIMDGEALVHARRDQDPSCSEDIRWLDELGKEPWPFITEEITLV